LFGHWRRLGFAIFPIPAAGLRLYYGNKKQTSKPSTRTFLFDFGKRKVSLPLDRLAPDKKKQPKKTALALWPSSVVTARLIPRLDARARPYARNAAPTSPRRYTSVRCSGGGGGDLDSPQNVGTSARGERRLKTFKSTAPSAYYKPLKKAKTKGAENKRCMPARVYSQNTGEAHYVEKVQFQHSSKRLALD